MVLQWAKNLGNLLRYNNYPKWMIDQHGRNNSPAGKLIDPETGKDVKKSIFISAPYFPGLSESFKQLFKYTHIQVCFKGQNIIKLMLMHTKDKVDISLKKDKVYQWSRTNSKCKSTYIGEGHSVNVPKSIVKKVPTLQCINIVLPKAVHSEALINSKSQIRKSLKWPMRLERQYTFESWILN